MTGDRESRHKGSGTRPPTDAPILKGMDQHDEARVAAVAAAFFLRSLRQATGWKPEVLSSAQLARSHRSKPGKAKLERAIDDTRKLLGCPAITNRDRAASDTGAVEMALWSMLGPRGVDVLVWESFGRWRPTSTSNERNVRRETTTASFPISRR